MTRATQRTPQIQTLKPLPEAVLDLRINVLFKPPLAQELRAMAGEYQTDPASVIRQLVVDALKARKRGA